MRRSIFSFLCLVLCSAPAWGHGMRTGYLELRETEPGDVLVLLRLTEPSAAMALSFSDGCGVTTLQKSVRNHMYRLSCASALAGQSVVIDGLGREIQDLVIVVKGRGGVRHNAMLFSERPMADASGSGDGGRRVWTVPTDPGVGGNLLSFANLGLKHILVGADHLLFLVLLVLLLGRVRHILIAEVLFAAAHTITFGLTSVGLVTVSAPVAEVLIAFSLLLMALQIPSGQQSLREGAVMAFVFGLVHGLGFASGLTDVGIPSEYVGSAVVGFGLGVEAGQLAVLLAFLALWQWLGRSRHRTRVAAIVTYVSGTVAAFWMLERLPLCFPSVQT